MIRSALYDPGNSQLQTGGIELVESWRQSQNSILWLDLEDEEPEVETSVLQQFGIHELAIQDALRTRHPPKLESFEDFVFILLRGLDAKTKDIDFGVIQLALFVSDRFLITRHQQASLSANYLWSAVQEKIDYIAAGPAALAVQLSNRLARRYVEILLDLEPRLDDVEEEMFAAPNDGQLADLTSYKSNLRQLARIARYHEHIFAQLKRGEVRYFDDRLKHNIIDLYEQTERTLSLADLYYQVASDLTDGYLALSSHRLNGVMQVLTIITVLFVPLTFLAGIYGMNFENMPELSTANGYFMVIGIMLGTAILQLFYFRRKGWL